MKKLVLNSQEITNIKEIIEEITSQYVSIEDEIFLKDINIFAHELPRRVREFLNDFRITESFPCCLISGFSINQKELISTPIYSWEKKYDLLSTFFEDVFLILLTSLTGQAFSWSNYLQEKIIHDIFPLKGDEKYQLSSGSKERLLWHTEDAFHPYRADYIGLMCLRNPQKAATTFACTNMLNLEPKYLKILFEPRFYIESDESHVKNHEFEVVSELDTLSSKSLQNNKEKVSIFFGDLKSPYIRADSLFMRPLEDDAEAQTALSILRESLDKHLQHIVLNPGDIFLIDNYRIVHGRESFEAKYDGNDRWLKRIFLTRDLRKSRPSRNSNLSRFVI